ncbi:MAG: tail fiber domain-containing protein [Saprospiraceae bacterium]
MKNIVITTIAFLFISNLLTAQVAQGFNYQGVARDQNNQPYINQAIALELTIQETNGTGIEYREIHYTQTSDLGVFNVVIGKGDTIIPKKFEDISWGTKELSLRTRIDLSGNGNNWQDAGRSELLSVPYAQYAFNGGGGGGSVNITGQNGVVVSPNGANYVISLGTNVDENKSDDVTKTDQADGDISGTFSNLQIKPNTIGTDEINNGSIMGSDLSNMNAQNGQVLKWNGSAWGPADDERGQGGDNWGTQTTVSNAPLSGNGTASNPLTISDNSINTTHIQDQTITGIDIQDGSISGTDLSSMNAQNNQVLKWNGSAWAPANDEQGQGGTGGDGWGTQTAVAIAPLSGNGTNSNPLTLTNNSINSMHIQDQSIMGSDLSSMNAQNNQVLKWNGSAWAPANDEQGQGGTGSDGWGTQTAVVNAPLTGNGTGNTPISLLNNSINATHLSPMGAQNGQVLKYNGSTWGPANDEQGGGGTGNITINAGNGINVNPTSGSDFTIINTAPDQMVTLTGAGNTTVSGSYPNFTISSSGGSGNSSPWSQNGASIYYNSGTVGIGTSSPQADFEVRDVNNSGAASIFAQTNTVNNTFASNTNGGLIGTQTSHPLNFITGGQNKMTLEANGDLKIGSSTILKDQSISTQLNFPLNINGVSFPSGGIDPTVLFPSRIKVGSGTGLNGTIRYQNNDIEGYVGNTWRSLTAGGIGGSGTTGYLPKFSASNSLTNSVIRESNGDIGIGVSPLPGTKLKVGGQLAVENQIRINGTNPMLLLQGSGGHSISTVSSSLTLSTGSSNKIYLQNGTNATLSVANNYVGINNSNPSNELDIVENSGGDYQIDLINGSNQWHMGAPAGATSFRMGRLGSSSYAFLSGSSYTWGVSSDRRLKEDIFPLESILQKILQLKVSRYKYITSSEPSIGLIAQEVQEVFPELVDMQSTKNERGDKVDMLTLNYSPLIYMSIKAIQEQQAIIDTQAKEIDALKNLLTSVASAQADMAKTIVALKSTVDASNAGATASSSENSSDK